MKNRKFLSILICSMTIILTSNTLFANTQPKVTQLPANIEESTNESFKEDASELLTNSFGTSEQIDSVLKKSLGTDETMNTKIVEDEVTINTPYISIDSISGNKCYRVSDRVLLAIRSTAEGDTPKYSLTDITAMLNELTKEQELPFKTYTVKVSSQPAMCIAYFDEESNIGTINILSVSPTGRNYVISSIYEGKENEAKAIKAISTVLFNSVPNGKTDLSALTNQVKSQQKETYTCTTDPNDSSRKVYKFNDITFSSPSELKQVQNASSNVLLTFECVNGPYKVEYTKVNMGNMATLDFIEKLQESLQKQVDKTGLDFTVRALEQSFGETSYTYYILDYLGESSDICEIKQHVLIYNGKAHIFKWRGSASASSATCYVDFMKLLGSAKLA